MSAIARVMLEMGYTVTGSDVAAQELTDKLIAKGAKIYIGHTAEQVKVRIWSCTQRLCPAIMWNG